MWCFIRLPLQRSPACFRWRCMLRLHLSTMHAVHAVHAAVLRAARQHAAQHACCHAQAGCKLCRCMALAWGASGEAAAADCCAHSLGMPMLLLSLQPGELMAGSWLMAADALWLEANRLAAAPRLGQETRRALDTVGVELADCLADALSRPASQRAQVRQQQLQLMRSLAELLQQVWYLPEQHEAARLETAQVAATRCCAYLRCTNVGGGGGPAAG